MPRQRLTLRLDGITAADYLQWVRDPDPPALDAGLITVSVEAAPLGDTVTAELDWAGPAPPAARAAPIAGLPLGAGDQVVGSSDGPLTRSHSKGLRSRGCCAPRGISSPPHTTPSPAGAAPLSPAAQASSGE